MPRKYENPPLVEALCEFRFLGEQAWDWTIPGIVYERIKAEYPEKRQEGVLEVPVRPTTDAMLVGVKTGVSKMQFFRADKSALVQVGPDLLAVNSIPQGPALPYPGWETFKPEVLKHLQSYREVANPKCLTRVGVRYINRLAVPTGEKFSLERYFRALPNLPAGLPQVLSTILINFEVPFDDPPGMLRFIFGSGNSDQPDVANFLLDMEMYVAGAQVPSLETVDQWLEKAHDRVEAAFDASFTDETHRDIFKEKAA
jgi:uncharacterized protein (TIGR04255 family)